MNDLTAAQLEALDSLEETADIAEPAVTAFLVVQRPDGQWTAHADIDFPLTLERQAHFDDFVAGAANVTMSCQIQQTAMHTLVMMNQQAQAVQAQMRAQQEAQEVNKLIDPRKLRA